MWPLFVFSSFLICPLFCLSFDLRLLVILLVSSNISKWRKSHLFKIVALLPTFKIQILMWSEKDNAVLCLKPTCFNFRELDFINLMAYDLHGSWEDFLGHNSPLYARSDESAEQKIFNQVNISINSGLYIQSTLY